jgi:hypothetical protein
MMFSAKFLNHSPLDVVVGPDSTTGFLGLSESFLFEGKFLDL